MKANRDLYDQLSNIWNKVFATHSGLKRKAGIDSFWNANKANASAIQEKIAQLTFTFKRRQKSIFEYFGQPQKSSSATSTREASITVDLTPREGNPSNLKAIATTVEVESSDTSKESEITTKCSETRAQDVLKREISALNSKIVGLQHAKTSGIATEQQEKDLQRYLLDVKNKKTRLLRLEQTQKRQQRFRENRKQALFTLKETEPEVYKKVIATTGVHPGTRGKPSLEVKQPLLLKAIVELVSPVSSAHERRRSEILRSCTTLDDLQKELARLGYNLSRSALYLRLLPNRSDTREGRRHKTTVPVKLIKATNDARSPHQDAHFCAATVKYLRNLAELLGSDVVFLLSQDDKARVPLGVTAAVKQAPLLMHVEYIIKLHDHDFPKGSRHKLIPSVYAGIEFDIRNGYSGPTFIAIRSGKHDKSSAASHAADFRRLYTIPDFDTTCKYQGLPKPVVIILTDGGPDENPRFEGTLTHMVSHFKQFNLDALFVACFAPGQSAYNPVERRMAALSKDLSGVVLPHDSFGSHLKGTKTVDAELEVRNFNKAGQVLAEIWDQNTIDNYKVTAQYIAPTEASYDEVPRPSEIWIAKHVRQSQYLLQIMKCDDQDCCLKPQTNIAQILQGFLPHPVAFVKTISGIRTCNPSEASEGTFFDLCKRIALNGLVPKFGSSPILPFDYYCPTIKGKLQERTCGVCGLYCPSKKAVQLHSKGCHKSSSGNIDDTIEFVIHQYVQEEDDDSDIEVITNIFTWTQSPFIECDGEENVQK